MKASAAGRREELKRGEGKRIGGKGGERYM